MSPGLPRLVVVTDRRMAQASGHRLVDVVSAAVSAVAPAPPVPEGATGSQVPIGVLLREKDLARPARAALAAELRAVLDRAGGAVLLVAGDVDLAGEVGADAVHLAAADP
ncbi:MAG: thiamine phosphate synthase, partial [Acidimicrobiia bacterium]